MTPALVPCAQVSSKQQNKGGASKNSKANINDTCSGALRAGIMSGKQRSKGGTGRSSKTNINDTCSSALRACTGADSEVPEKRKVGLALLISYALHAVRYKNVII